MVTDQKNVTMTATQSLHPILLSWSLLFKKRNIGLS